jgi:hypothetical protein
MQEKIERAYRARQALEAYCGYESGQAREEAMTALVTDLLHLASNSGVDGADVLHRALSRYAEEVSNR